MNNINWKLFIRITVGVSVLIWAIILLISGTELRAPLIAIKKLPSVITIDLILWAGFVKWGWRLRILQGWLVPFPDLQGTWEGTVRTTWSDPDTNESPQPIRAVLIVRQSFLTVSCVMHTQEMTSTSYSTDFLLDNESGVKKLIYSYVSVPRATVRDRSEIHDGTALLKIASKLHRELEGEYWTSRKSTGEITLRYWKPDLLDSFPKELPG